MMRDRDERSCLNCGNRCGLKCSINASNPVETNCLGCKEDSWVDIGKTMDEEKSRKSISDFWKSFFNLLSSRSLKITKEKCEIGE